MASIYDSILPTQTHISQNTPQYVSVFDNVVRSDQPITTVSPLTITSPNKGRSSSIAVNNVSGNTILTAAGDAIVQTTQSVALICGPTAAVTLGSSTAAGGSVVSINGDSGLSRLYDTIYNPPPTAPVAVAIFTSGTTINHDTVQSESFTIPSGVGTKYYVMTISGTNGFSDDAVPPSIPNNGLLQAWVAPTSGASYLVAKSQASMAHSEFVVRPSAAVGSYLNGSLYNKSSSYFSIHPGTYNIRLAWWSNQPLVLGSLGNVITVTLWRFD